MITLLYTLTKNECYTFYTINNLLDNILPVIIYKNIS